MLRSILRHTPLRRSCWTWGLGKTSITLTALNDLLFNAFEIRKAIVIAPLRVARDTWPAEIEKWDHLSGLIYSVAVGTEAERLAALRRQADIYIINRENVQWLVEASGVPFDYDMVVVDELSSFKNHQSKRFRAMMKVRPKVERIVGLTGTPSSNGLMTCGLSLSCWIWAAAGEVHRPVPHPVFLPDKRNGQVVFPTSPFPERRKQIYRLISDITISMKSADYLQMPRFVSSGYEVYLSEEEAQRYVSFKRDLLLNLPDGKSPPPMPAALSGKLSQMANGAVYTDTGEMIAIHDRKLDALEDIIESMGGKPLLVAYWFRHDLERIMERLHKLKIPFSRLDSPDSIRRWNAGELPVALIHPASAGHGLNLQSGGSTL